MASTCNGHVITGIRITAAMRPFRTEDAKFKAVRLAAAAAAASFNPALRAAKTRVEANMQVLEPLSNGSIQTLAKAVCSKSKLVPESSGESAWWRVISFRCRDFLHFCRLLYFIFFVLFSGEEGGSRRRMVRLPGFLG
ncbi:hypothetical protein MYCTH_2307246 [Thermothelomyces thermophilus ATCC 42464]|uniref:Uncharacterized protein n=1 Tax=Thermothelomyces thermophilus (strain ATCC 42464 / BCRC 31852 / DSM 1799) TaxID=573729 RepID=G2QFF4_THET4|nr:uncharacterized protein MYCTH_2307246 [Thermothelomyces thermophilus ATCC 42464]AEO59183.1 hypothetical protein MYCTH_2307246 [Thermothelomyces thermophilus ATCC 42464]